LTILTPECRIRHLMSYFISASLTLH